MEFILATHNDHKAQEIRSILKDLNVSIKSLADINYHQDIVEDGADLNANAWIKSDHIRELLGGNVLADDTGLEVDALHGAPGVHSARYAGLQRNSDDNMDKLLTELLPHRDRSAQFRTVIAVWLEGQKFTFQGIVRGIIAMERSGAQGFGYDPIFIPDGYDQSFGELSPEIKNQISHRGRAIAAFKKFLVTRT